MSIVTVRDNCVKCNRKVEFEVTSQEFKNWQDGMLIQRAMPNLNADQREFLMSGICGSCFDEMFRPEDSD